MAKLKFGVVVVDARGKSNGHVFTKNRAGNVLRTKVTPVNPQTVSQTNVRSRFTTQSQGWRGLSEAQRTAWNAAVQFYKKTDVFGDMKTPSGFNLYCALNNNLALAGVSAISTPPVPAAVGAMSSMSVVMDNSSQSATLTFAPAIPAGSVVKLEATAAISPGVNYVKSQFRVIDVLTNSDTSPHVATTEYIAKFGSVGAVGQKVFFKATYIDTTTGQQGASTVISSLIVT